MGHYEKHGDVEEWVQDEPVERSASSLAADTGGAGEGPPVPVPEPEPKPKRAVKPKATG